ncbi:T9SS type B sorting domain-containing protein [Changchengzhania lutea]|uniref:T9SS type B sorting domain-containing protein n=1 Tax=Changchengzhania lutea TaxID=2049305 RepID=UPI00115F4D6B|nr:T9SS type B sorting domain-containing protein [Changchengzhania lutea]
MIFGKNKTLLVFIISSITILKINAQLGFCGGNSGDPIFTEKFGTGSTAVALPDGTTTYTFRATSPNDGFYQVSNNTNWFGWHDILDHTPNDTNGRLLIVNADFTAGEFYRTNITGLCENTTYEFSSWLINLLPSSGCGGAGIPINVKFEIWDSTDTNLLASGDTGSISGTSSPNWEQYALVFKTLPSQTNIILKMLNNGVGGCGNDLGIDDIVFKTCGDNIIVEDTAGQTEINLCEDEIPFSTELTVVPDFSIFSSHFYQWQQSTDGISWTDISGETNNTYTVPAVSNTILYRALVAEDAVNVSNASCNSISEIFEINIIPFPEAPVNNGDVLICENETMPLTVSVPNGVIANWYDASIGGNLLQANSTSYNPANEGVFYAEAETVTAGCKSLSRTEIRLQYFETPQVQDDILSFCEDTTIILEANANIATVTYLWSTGAITETIEVSEPGIYTVAVSNGNCTVTKTIELNQIDTPVIDSVISDGNDIIMTTTNSGDFLYSINGNVFQPSNTFEDIEGGLYTLYVREQNGCGTDTTQFIHFYIPKFFTPNNDGVNDEFDLKGIEFFANSQVSIFNRYGKLLKNSRNAAFSWDGTYNNTNLPSDDYWYLIIIDNQKFNGHFTLKR